MSDASPQTLLYVAYARTDVARVEPIVTALRERGFAVRFDTASAHGSGGYVQDSQRALSDAGALVVFLSQAATQSPWVDSETRAFQAQMARGGNRRLIAVRLDEIALPVALTPYTTVDAVEAAPAMVAATLTHALSAPAAAPAAATPPATAQTAPAPAPTPSESSAGSVHLAYAGADAARVEPIVTALRARGVAAHLDTARAHGGGDYAQAIQQTLEQASALVVFVSRASSQSSWVEFETRAFQARMARGGNRKLIAVRLDEMPLPVALTPYVTVDAVGASSATVASTLAHYLSASVETPASPAPATTAEPQAPEWARQWDLVKQAREREAAAAVGAVAVEPEPAAPAEPEPAESADTAPAGDRLVWTGEQWVWASDQPVSRDAVSEPLPPAAPAEEPATSSDAPTEPAPDDSEWISRGADVPPPEPTPEAQDETVKAPAVGADPGSPSTAAEAPLAPEESDFGNARGGWQEPIYAQLPDEPYTEPAPASPAEAATPLPVTQPKGMPEPLAPPAPPLAPPAPAPESIGHTTGVLPPLPSTGAQPTRLEQVTFTAYHPREMQSQQWQPLVLYISLDNPATLALVSAAAAERLGGKRDQFRPGRADKPAGLARGAALRIVPSMPGFEFNPSYLDVTWQEDVQEHQFRMQAKSAQPGRAANGVVQIYQGLLLRAEVPLSVFVGQATARLDSPDAYQQAIARAYRRVFASYSHRDTPVVESCETAARTMGDQYLRDVTLLQAGTQWDPRLIQAINDADVFQLFWSKRAAASPYVEREWRHALQLLPARPNFIRPVYWSRQLHPAPQELNALHFQPLSLTSLGWGWLHRTVYGMGNG